VLRRNGRLAALAQANNQFELVITLKNLEGAPETSSARVPNIVRTSVYTTT